MKTWQDFNIQIPAGPGPELFTTCPQCSQTRKKKAAKCLSANIEKGVWFCNHCSWSGTLKTGQESPRKKLYTRPEWPKNERESALETFSQERGIPLCTIQSEGIVCVSAYMPQVEDTVECLAFPYLKSGELVNLKYRSVEGKMFRQVGGAEKVLYRQDRIRKDTVIITEGEVDALSCVVAGFDSVVSVPDGAPAPTTKNYAAKFTYLDQEPDPFDGVQDIVLAVDNDEPGQVLREELARRLGAERCRLVTWPSGCKDANDVLRTCGPKILTECLKQARPYPIQDIVEVIDTVDAVLRDYEQGPTRGLSTGWEAVDQFYTVQPGQLTIITGIPGHGKALALDTLLPTPSGWTTMGDVKVGDYLFDERGVPCQVMKTTDILYGRPCYRLRFSDGTTVVADALHQWVTTSQAAKRSFRNARKNDRLIPRNCKVRGTDQTYKRVFPHAVTTEQIAMSLIEGGKTNHAIQCAEPLHLPEQTLPIRPYTLGAWLGDGNSRNAGICDAEGFIVTEIMADGYPVKKWGEAYAYGIGGGMHAKLRECGLLGNKHIPSMYLRASYNQRLAILQGLMDTDGSCAKDGQCEFSNTNRRLIDDVYELLVSLGIKVTMGIGRATIKGRDVGEKYRLIFKPTWSPFRMRRKSDRVSPVHRFGQERRIISCEPIASVPVRCVQVNSPSHLYLCSQSMIPTHNSEWLDALALNMAELYDWHIAVCSPENSPIELHVEKLLEKVTRKPFRRGPNPRMDQRQMATALEWLHAHVTFIMPSDILTLDDVIQRATVLVRRKGIKGLIIDPFNEFDHKRPPGQSETEYIGATLTKVRQWARKHQVALWMVAHPQKLYRREDGTFPVPTPWDISGSANWRNKADNCITVWRDVEAVETPVQVHVQKVKFKHIGTVGMAELQWDWLTGRYRSIVQQGEGHGYTD